MGIDCTFGILGAGRFLHSYSDAFTLPLEWGCFRAMRLDANPGWCREDECRTAVCWPRLQCDPGDPDLPGVRQGWPAVVGVLKIKGAHEITRDGSSPRADIWAVYVEALLNQLHHRRVLEHLRGHPRASTPRRHHDEWHTKAGSDRKSEAWGPHLSLGSDC